MDDEEFERLLQDFLDPPSEPNPSFEAVRIVWVRDSEAHGALHMWLKHGVREHEVEEVIFQVPPEVEAKRDPEGGRTAFFGATAHDRQLFVVCEDWVEDGQRHLKPITAFDCTEEYWRKK